MSAFALLNHGFFGTLQSHCLIDPNIKPTQTSSSGDQASLPIRLECQAWQRTMFPITHACHCSTLSLLLRGDDNLEGFRAADLSLSPGIPLR